jgi:hypothetical protein
VLNGDGREGVRKLSAVALYTIIRRLAVWGQVISISLNPVKNSWLASYLQDVDASCYILTATPDTVLFYARI